MRTYVKFKEKPELEEYLKIEDLSIKCRKLFCAFRISCHDLEIERGRYCNPPKPPEQRICSICKLEAETEEHFMMLCSGYIKLRIVLFKEILKYDSEIFNVPQTEKFTYLISHKNVNVLKAIMIFLEKAYQNRALILCGKDPMK